MKKIIKKSFISSLFISLALIISCGTTNIEQENNTAEEPEINQTEENLSDTDNLEDEVLLIDEVIEPEEEVVEPSPVELWVQSLEGIKLEIIEAPTKWINYGKTFNSPYTVLVTDAEGNPVSDFDLRISYPEDRKDGDLWITSIDVKTNEEGKYSFIPENTKFAADSKVGFYPSPLVFEQTHTKVIKAEDTDFIGPDTEDLENLLKDEQLITNVINEKIVVADYKVRSDLVSKGAVLFVWDFNERNRPMVNSNELLSELRTNVSTMFGNAPINEISDIGKSLKTLYNENYEIIGGNNYGYLIVGTIKFTKPVEACEDGSGYLCSLIAEISAVNMKTGNQVFSRTFTNEAIGSNWNTSTSTCKKQIAKQIVDALLYGL